jgi:hypothetical protein
MPGGNGHYWLYRDGRFAAENVLFRSFGKPPTVSHLQIWGDALQWSVDDVQVWSNNPLAIANGPAAARRSRK